MTPKEFQKPNLAVELKAEIVSIGPKNSYGASNTAPTYSGHSATGSWKTCGGEGGI